MPSAELTEEMRAAFTDLAMKQLGYTMPEAEELFRRVWREVEALLSEGEYFVEKFAAKFGEVFAELKREHLRERFGGKEVSGAELERRVALAQKRISREMAGMAAQWRLRRALGGTEGEGGLTGRTRKS